MKAIGVWKLNLDEMKWVMEMEEMEAVMEKIWDLHDKLSDAIHSISRAHYLNSLNFLRNSHHLFLPKTNISNNNKKPDDHHHHNNHRPGFVFVKDFRIHDDDDDDYSSIQEAKSLNAIRTALENLEDRLEFFHTVQVQQRAERDAAIARLEQSRIILAIRLTEHQGKRYKVIEEALAFVADVRDTNRFVSPDHLYGSAPCPPGDFVPHEAKRSINLIKVLLNSLNFAKKSLKLDRMGGLIGNAALVAFSMLALMHLNQAASKDKYLLDHSHMQEDVTNNRNVRKATRPEGSSSSGHLIHLDVMLARG